MRHAKMDRGRLTLRFWAKSGKQCQLCVSDKGLIRFVRQMQDLPGQHLFQYLLEDGTACPVDSRDVNAYVREAMGEDFTAKDFRTWRASALAFEWLAGKEQGGMEAMLSFVSEQLCNTPAIARKSYVHPALLEAARDRRNAFRKEMKLPRATKWLSRYERGLIGFLNT